MYLCDTIDVILKTARECIDLLILDGVNHISNIVHPPIFNQDGTPKDWVGAMIFLDMCELHRYRFGLFTDDVLKRFTGLVVDGLKRDVGHVEPYKVNRLYSITHNVVGLLDTILRLLNQYDTGYYLA